MIIEKNRCFRVLCLINADMAVLSHIGSVGAVIFPLATGFR